MFPCLSRQLVKSHWYIRCYLVQILIIIPSSYYWPTLQIIKTYKNYPRLFVWEISDGPSWLQIDPVFRKQVKTMNVPFESIWGFHPPIIKTGLHPGAFLLGSVRFKIKHFSCSFKFNLNVRGTLNSNFWQYFNYRYSMIFSQSILIFNFILGEPSKSKFWQYVDFIKTNEFNRF